MYALLSPCECFGGLLLFAQKRRAARPVARANTNAPIAAIHSPSVVNMPRYYCDYCDTHLTHDSVS
jgi:hypothetical protein